MYGKLHIYPTDEPDGECVIVGDKNSLMALSKMLQRAASNNIDYRKFYAGDGHQYRVVVCKESDEDIWEHLQVPYTDPLFTEQRQEYVSVKELEHLDFYNSEKHKLR